MSVSDNDASRCQGARRAGLARLGQLFRGCDAGIELAVPTPYPSRTPKQTRGPSIYVTYVQDAPRGPRVLTGHVPCWPTHRASELGVPLRFRSTSRRAARSANGKDGRIGSVGQARLAPRPLCHKFFFGDKKKKKKKKKASASLAVRSCDCGGASRSGQATGRPRPLIR